MQSLRGKKSPEILHPPKTDELIPKNHGMEKVNSLEKCAIFGIHVSFSGV